MFIDLTGQRFGRLVVLMRDYSKNGSIYWKSLCDCGNTAVVQGKLLRTGTTKSCGCYHRDGVRKRLTTHGMSKHPTYFIWKSMWDRCQRKNSHSYKNYGGRGIAVCPSWRHFSNFLRDMGERPAGFTLERIDNNKGYFPGNCKWATRIEQNRNTRMAKLITFNGETLPQAEWSRRLGGSQSGVGYRLRAGWPIIKALTIPLGRRKYETV